MKRLLIGLTIVLFVPGCVDRNAIKDEMATDREKSTQNDESSSGSEKIDKVDVQITEDGIAIAGKKISLPVSVSGLEKILGKYDRRTKTVSKNIVLTWDNLGIHCLIEENKRLIDEINFTLENLNIELDFASKKKFEGRFELFGVQVDSNSSIKDLNEEFAGKPFQLTNKSFQNWWRVQYPEFKVYTSSWDEKPTGISTITINAFGDN